MKSKSKNEPTPVAADPADVARARRLTDAMVAATGEFAALGLMPPCPERARLVLAVDALGGAALAWAKRVDGPRRTRKRRRNPDDDLLNLGLV